MGEIGIIEKVNRVINDFRRANIYCNPKEILLGQKEMKEFENMIKNTRLVKQNDPLEQLNCVAATICKLTIITSPLESIILVK